MKLFIAEKPSLARAIATGIGAGKNFDGYISLNGGKEIVTACFGHILENFNPDDYSEKYLHWRMEDLPIIPTQWKLKVKPDAAKQFKIIRALIGKADIIVNAGDPDREGQLLVDEVLNFVGNKKPVQRILLNALDEKSVRQSLNDLRDNKNFQGLKNAALGRSRADWLIGMNLSRVYTIRARQAGYENISVGRVMTPTMALVVRRDEEMKNFKPVTHFAIQASFKNNFGEIPATWQMSDKILNLDSEGRLLDKKIAENFLDKIKILIIAVKPKDAIKTLSDLKDKIDLSTTIFSVVAGLKLEVLEKYFPGHAIVRVMPNVNIAVGEGMNCYAPNKNCLEVDKKLAEKFCSSIGRAVEVDEKLMDAVTGLSGSGPAYAFLVIDALADGGVAAGLPRNISIELAAQTLLGAAKMVLETNEHPDALRDKVTSPAGTTIEGVRILERGGVRSAMIEAVIAATEKSKKLG